MAPLRIGFVREHFSSPLLQFADDDKENTFTLVSCPSGTGQIVNRLRNNEIDVAIALTDPLIAAIAKGETSYTLVGSYVSTPLNWAVVTGAKSSYNSISDLRGTTFGISRTGSGSETMANVLALQQGWIDKESQKVEKLNVKINNDIEGLNKSVNEGSTSAYMWEWFTTKPWADSGEVRFIGSVPTPWPSWMIAASTSQDHAPTEAVHAFLTSLNKYVTAFNSAESRAKANVEFIKERFGYPEADIVAWLATVGYPDDITVIKKTVIEETLQTLEKTGFITAPERGFSVAQFTNDKVAQVI